MYHITVNELIQFFKKQEISFHIPKSYPEDKSFTFASIFEPISNGFYFYLGDEMKFPITDSLLLVNQNNQIKSAGHGNIPIYIDANPQIVFYEILLHFHEEKSNGHISPLSVIHEDAKIGKNVQIDAFCVIGKATIGDNCIIKSHCTINDNSEIQNNVHIDSGSVIGARGVAWIWNESETEKIIQPQIGGVEIGAYSFLGAHSVVVRGSINEKTRIGHHTLLAPGSRIGHGTQIGNYVHFANNVITGGNTKIADYCFVGSSAVFRPKVKLKPETIVGAGAVVTKDNTEVGSTLVGVPAKQLKTKSHPSGMPKPKSKSSRK